jgi:hypothetical protein
MQSRIERMKVVWKSTSLKPNSTLPKILEDEWEHKKILLSI